MATMQFTKNPKGSNYLLKCGDFYISYNSSPFGGGFLGSDTGGAETALKGVDGKWRILNGDFRKEYEAAATLGWQACLDFYEQESKKDGQRSSWSTD